MCCLFISLSPYIYIYIYIYVHERAPSLTSSPVTSSMKPLRLYHIIV